MVQAAREDFETFDWDFRVHRLIAQKPATSPVLSPEATSICRVCGSIAKTLTGPPRSSSQRTSWPKSFNSSMTLGGVCEETSSGSSHSACKRGAAMDWAGVAPARSSRGRELGRDVDDLRPARQAKGKGRAAGLRLEHDHRRHVVLHAFASGRRVGMAGREVKRDIPWLSTRPMPSTTR